MKKNFMAGFWVRFSGKEDALFITESPTKCKQIMSYITKSAYPNACALTTQGHFLTLTDTKDYGIKGLDKVLSGNAKSLSGKELTPLFKLNAWHSDIENNLDKAIKIVKKNKGKVFVCSDPDREGELIAYEVISWFDLKESDYIRCPAMDFSEEQFIPLVKKCEKEKRKLDYAMFQSAVLRTILDKLYGFVQTQKLWEVSKAKSAIYHKEVIAFLEKKLDEFIANNKSLKNNDQFKNITNKYQDMIDNLKNKKNEAVS